MKAPNSLPTAVASATPSSGNAPLTTTLDASGSTDTDGNIVSYSWAWGGGSATGITVNETFAAGFYDVTLTVTDNEGGVGTTVLFVESINPNADTDGDGVNDSADNCPTVSNSDQTIPTFFADFDLDGFGDPNDSIVACEAPSNYVSNNLDNCPTFNSTNLMDTDGDGIGDECDQDDDNDGVADSLDCDPLDAMIGGPLTYYLDVDGDGFGDDATSVVQCAAPAGYVTQGGDNCPDTYNVDQMDTDGDGKGDSCDLSPAGRTSFWLEGECAIIGSEWTIEVDPTASNGESVVFYGDRNLNTPLDTAINRVRFVVNNVQGRRLHAICSRLRTESFK